MPSKLQAVHSIRRSAKELRVRPVTTSRQSTVFTKYIGKLKVGPAEQGRLSLGVFGTDRPEKGFSIELRPDPSPAESIVTEMFSIGSPARYELFLMVANYGNRAVTAEVWRM